MRKLCLSTKFPYAKIMFQPVRLLRPPPPLPPPLYSKPKKLVYSHKYILTPQIHLLVHNRRRSCVFINFEHTSYLFPVFLLWSLNK